MTRIDVDPAVLRKAIQDLEISIPIYAAYIEDDQLFITTRDGTDTLPVACGGRTTTIPNKSTIGSGLDDFTAISGVGSVTASKLHNAGFYTFDDLRLTPGVLNDLVGVPTAEKIRHWLDQHD